mgnify:CR=1 FL=1
MVPAMTTVSWSPTSFSTIVRVTADSFTLGVRIAAPFLVFGVVFFFGLPNEGAAQRVVERLVRDGYAAEYKHVPDQAELSYAVHAQRSIRLSVSDMQETSRKFNDMAAEFHGRYDGWAAAHNKRPE